MNNLSEKQQKVFNDVEKLYLNSPRDMGRWMWKHHVQWVAEKVGKLAEKYGAHKDMVVVGALLHDLGDVKYERTDNNHELWGNEKSRFILSETGFSPDEIAETMKNIIDPHSCHPDNLPTTMEGKILATADAMFHLQTDFFIQLSWMHLPPWKKSFDEWKEWVVEKLDRDYNSKIFFDDEKEEIEPNYNALKLIFS